MDTRSSAPASDLSKPNPGSSGSGRSAKKSPAGNGAPVGARKTRDTNDADQVSARGGRQGTGETVRTLPVDPQTIIDDYRLAYRSRQASLLGRKEVLTGKAKFGIFGDGKEVAQLAMARAFRKGDFRAGYYRDQTFMFATGMSNLEEFFAQLYANTDVGLEPHSAGRSMNSHYATRSLDAQGRWKNLADMYNSSADGSPTASQMPRLVGLSYASKLYRELEALRELTAFSHNGDEVAFGTIGNASCAEGMFWETINAVGVLQAPLVMSIWDDGYGISVPNAFQITKSNLSEMLSGFQRNDLEPRGYDLYTVKGWDYPALIDVYQRAADVARRSHVPAIIHVTEVTQPQGHSTSGSHERYKSKERLQWETEYCCLRQMRLWMIGNGVATAEQMDVWEEEERQTVRDVQRRSWEAYRAPIDQERDGLVEIVRQVGEGASQREKIDAVRVGLERLTSAYRRDLVRAATEVLVLARDEDPSLIQPLAAWRTAELERGRELYSTDLVSGSSEAALNVPVVPARFSEDSPIVNGFEVLNACFDAALRQYPNLIALGEDVGHLGDVNQGFAGLQEKHGVLRVSDTGIRECTIMGQAIGMAQRGLRPLAEIQYLDYILYGLQILSDDLACLRWRTKSGQKAPVIVRTRGHRLEGIWHSGSPMAGIIHLVRGIHVLVPRNMVQAAGFYNTMLRSDDPAIIVEVLNGYRSKERRPDNIGEFTVPLGVPEVLRPGNDVTLVTYGACCRIAAEAADLLAEVGIDVEIVDVQTLLPFDRNGVILESLKKTSRIVFLDEDVPGGTTAYMMQQVLEVQGGYEWLDSQPVTVSGQAHRPAYGSDGDYWSKPSREEVFEKVYALMHEADPRRFPRFFR